MKKVVLSDHAISDLETIGNFIAQDSVQSAEGVLDYLEEQLKALAEMPTMGRERPDLWPKVLCFVVGRSQWRSRFLIFYRSIKGGIEVARIIEGHRHIQMALDNPPPDTN